MKLNKKQLRQLIESEIKIISEAEEGPPYDKYRHSQIAFHFGELDFDVDEEGGPGSILREVGPNALKDLAKFIKSNAAWKAWYESVADDGTGGTA